MELIIKPTEACNFKCTFCSSTEISESKANRLSHAKIFEFLRRFPETNTIIVNGGDPLMVPPQYYFKIINFLDENNLPANLSFTSNLWGFFLDADKWAPLFRHPRVNVTTSFNYGTTRRVSANKVYTEDLFWKVSNMFLERVGYRPDFISVINDENEDSAIDNVRLAQKMNVECKLNYAMASGAQSSPFVLSKIYKIYLEIFRLGLTAWEFNTKQLVKRISKLATVCPQNRSCDSGIRCLQPDGDYYSCGAFGDDRKYAISFKQEMVAQKISTPLQDDINLLSLKSECFTCPMFDICNGCKKTIADLKRAELVESHCTLMKTLAPDILQLQFAKIPPTHQFIERHKLNDFI